MPKIQLLLGMEIAQIFMIRVDNKFSRQQVMTPCQRAWITLTPMTDSKDTLRFSASAALFSTSAHISPQSSSVVEIQPNYHA